MVVSSPLVPLSVFMDASLQGTPEHAEAQRAFAIIGEKVSSPAASAVSHRLLLHSGGQNRRCEAGGIFACTWFVAESSISMLLILVGLYRTDSYAGTSQRASSRIRLCCGLHTKIQEYVLIGMAQAWSHYEANKKEPIALSAIEDVFKVFDDGTGKIAFKDLERCLTIFGGVSGDNLSPEEVKTKRQLITAAN